MMISEDYGFEWAIFKNHGWYQVARIDYWGKNKYDFITLAETRNEAVAHRIIAEQKELCRETIARFLENAILTGDPDGRYRVRHNGKKVKTPYFLNMAEWQELRRRLKK